MSIMMTYIENLVSSLTLRLRMRSARSGNDERAVVLHVDGCDLELIIVNVDHYVRRREGCEDPTLPM